MCEKHNGWTNYETWNAALWLDNSEGVQGYWQGRVGELKDGHTDVDDDGDETIDMDTVAVDLARELEADIDENRPDLGANMFADLLGASLSAIDWQEIADHMVSE